MKKSYMWFGEKVAQAIGFKEGWILMEETGLNSVKPIRQATRKESAILDLMEWAHRKRRAAYWYIRLNWKWLLVWSLELAVIAISLYLIAGR